MATVDPLKALSIPRLERKAPGLFESFVKRFVINEHHVRIFHLVKKKKWIEALKRTEAGLNPDCCTQECVQSRPDNLPELFESRGVYFSGFNPALEMEASQALVLSFHNTEDAIFVLDKSNRAIFINHDWGVWYCESPNQPLQTDLRPQAGSGC